MNCSVCHAPTPTDARFCPNCGASIATDPSRTQDDHLRSKLEEALVSQYDILRVLGKGGMGAVYLARERALDRLVAIKVLPPERGFTPEMQERFKREARTAAKLTHPNIVPLHSFGEAEGLIYYVMGYVAGESLADLLEREERIPHSQIRQIIADIAGALDYAHRHGVVHRDVKPGNVLLDDESGRAMLVDFGVARAQATDATLTVEGSVIGTPHYISPEQASGHREIDGRSDLYSLGIMGYVMITGELPFDGETAQEIIVQHLSQEAVPIKNIEADIPADLVSVITRCLAKDPEKRWIDGKSLLDELNLLAVDEDSLPEDLKEIESQWSGPISIALVVGFYLILVTRLWNIPIEGGIPWIFILLPPAISMVSHWVNWRIHLRPNGRSWSETWRALLREPRWLKWWSLWYPRALSRPSTIRMKEYRKCLPRSLRLLGDFTLFYMLFFITIGGWYFLVLLSRISEPAEMPSNTLIIGYFGFLLTLVLIVSHVWIAFVWQVKRRFNNSEYIALLGQGDLARDPEFWEQPKIQQYLSPALNGKEGTPDS